MCYNLVGFESSLGATTFVVVLTAVMLAVSLAVILVSAVSAARAKTMRLVSSKREPMRDGITLADSQQWHLFLSHVWSTGQVLLTPLLPHAFACAETVPDLPFHPCRTLSPSSRTSSSTSCPAAKSSSTSTTSRTS